MSSSTNHYKTRSTPVAKKPPPSTSANGKAKTTKTKTKPMSAEERSAFIEGINEDDQFLDQYENDQIRQRIKSIMPGVRVTETKREALLMKLQQALHLMGGFGFDEYGQKIPLSDILSDPNIIKDIIKDVQDASNSNRAIELWAFYEYLNGYYPVHSNNEATNEAVAGEIIEFLGSKGERFFHDKDDTWLCKQLGRPGNARKPSRRTLIRKLRKKLGYTYLNHQLPALDARCPSRPSVDAAAAGGASTAATGGASTAATGGASTAAAGGEGGIVGNNNGKNEHVESLHDQQIEASLCQQLAATNIFNITVNNITSTTVNDNSNTSIVVNNNNTTNITANRSQSWG